MKAPRILLLLALIAIAFVGGFGYGRCVGAEDSNTSVGQKGVGARILYYQDPMHPVLQVG